MPSADFQVARLEKSASPVVGQKRTVLIADDDNIFRTVAASLVASWGYDCVSVADGAAALQVLERDPPPTIAIVDWLMPQVTGTEICRHIRSSSCPRYVYFILVSARDGREDSIEGLRSGADSYISKPLDAEELRTKLEVANRILFMEESLRDLHAETEFFINSVPSVLIGTDAQGRITRWNHGAQEVFALSISDVQGRTLDDCGISWTRPHIQPYVQQALETGQKCRLDDLPVLVAAQQRVVALNIHPLRSHVGEIAGTLIIGADVTEKSLLEEQLRQAQKLEAIGQLAAGIAHEINTPVQFVSDNVSFFKDSWASLAQFIANARSLRAALPPGTTVAPGLAAFDASVEQLDLDYLLREIPQAISQTQDGLQRVSKIVRAMKEFSHQGSPQKEPADINRAIETTITVARNEWKYVAEVETQFDTSLPLVPCLVSQFNQAVLNIIINAAHAIAEVVGEGTGAKGRIVIRTRRDKDAVEISVSDTGKGIPESIRSRLFEPFFTTKEVGKGTGQGLTLAYSIVTKDHKGQIWFDSELGRGTTFFIRLPLKIE